MPLFIRITVAAIQSRLAFTRTRYIFGMMVRCLQIWIQLTSCLWSIHQSLIIRNWLISFSKAVWLKRGEEDLRRLGKPVCCMMDHCRNTRLMRLELWFCVRLVISIWGCWGMMVSILTIIRTKMVRIWTSKSLIFVKNRNRSKK